MTDEVFRQIVTGLPAGATTGHLFGRIRERIGTRIRREGD